MKKVFQVEVTQTNTTELIITVTAKDEKEALKKAQDWDYDDITDEGYPESECNWEDANVTELN